MTPRKASLVMKNYFSILAAIAILVIAAIRVYPYINNPRHSNRNAALDTTESIIPEYDDQQLRDGIENLEADVEEKVYSELLKINSSTRPEEHEARVISSVYADFLVRNRTGSLDNLLAVYEERGVPPSPALVQADRSRANLAWRLSTVWARHRQIDVDSIIASTKYYQGTRYNQRFINAAISERQLRNGKHLHQLQSHNYTAYEIAIRATVLDFDGESEFPVFVWTTIVNEGAAGSWDVVQTTWSDLPDGRRFQLPYP